MLQGRAMAMRFSIKWLLAGMAYAALAAAALGQPHWVLTDLLWLVNFLAVSYACILLLVARGDRQARAAGFVTGCALLLLTLQFSAAAVPTNRLVTSLSGNSPGQLPAYVGPPIYPQPYAPTPTIRYAPPATTPPTTSQPQIGTSVIVATPTPAYQVFPAPILPTVDYTAQHRAANTLSVMIAGLAGFLLAGLASRRRQLISTGPADNVE
jgi:hypothetical protein